MFQICETVFLCFDIYTEVWLGSRLGQQWCAKHIEVHERGERDVFSQPDSLVSNGNSKIETGLHMKKM